jgi:RimJ/RimL family protein N-acetyltransferase
LRKFKLADFDYFVEFFSDADASRHVGGPSAVEDIWRRMLAGVGLWAVTGLGMWAVERREDGKTIGHIGLFDFLRTCEPSIAGQPEMGWILAPSAHGKGYALEACNAILEWFEDNFGKLPIWALISPANQPSMKLAEKLGFVRQPDGLYRDKAETFWLRPA